MNDCSVFWDDAAERAVVRHVSLRREQGRRASDGWLVGLAGPVGAGKSSLLLALLGEARVRGGGVALSAEAAARGLGFVGQHAWLQQASVRDNVLFGRPFDTDAYERALDACALRADVARMADADRTDVGEGGVALSGGQRTRLALARALYQDLPIYLLDDPLASVDARVGEHLWRRCVLEQMRGRGKTVLVATHHVHLLADADWLVLLGDSGVVIRQGPPAECLPTIFPCLMQKGHQTDATVERHSSESDMIDSAELLLPQEEFMESGTVQLRVYSTYISALGFSLAALILLTMLLMQGSKNLSDWWLAVWVASDTNGTDTLQSHFRLLSFTSFPMTLLPATSHQLRHDEQESSDVSYYLKIYALIAAANSAFTLARAFLFAYAGVGAARRTHDRLLARVVQATVGFFERTPLGRVLNRFSSDLYAVDETLPFQANILCKLVLAAVGTALLASYALPAFVPCLLLLSALFYAIQKYYRYTTCDLKRLMSVSLSPLYSHFADTASGAVSVRAFRATRRFEADLAERLTASQRAQLSVLASGQWLGVRLQALAVAAVAAVALVAVLQHRLGRVDPGLVGLAVSYALSVTSLLSGLLQSFTETEKELVSVERIHEYATEIAVEEAPSSLLPLPYNGWPDQGRVEFRNVSLRYSEGLPLALDNVTLKIGVGERVGIIGRTGSGKSSLLQALFRAVDLASGEVFVDGVNIAHVDRKLLRTSMSLIPQSPFIFSGSLRENLCLGAQVAADQLHVVVRQAGLEALAARLGGVDGTLAGGGAALSAGERQLVCVARALLRRAAVVCVDEATAHVDGEADARIQRLLRDGFRGATVVTIAHRLDTLADYDRLVLMRDGRIAAVGSPADMQAATLPTQ